MNLSAPTQVVFLLSLILVVLALIAHFVSIQGLSQYQYWVAIAGYAVLMIGCLMKGK